MEFNPVGRWRTSDENEFIFLQMEKNPVTYDIAVVTAWHILFSLVERKICKTVDGCMREQLNRIGTFDINIHHMVRLVEKNASLPPRTLLVAPVGKLGRDDRVDIGAYLRIT